MSLKKNFNSFSEMYFESMMIFNSCLTYKNSINKPKGVIELSVNFTNIIRGNYMKVIKMNLKI